LSQLPVTYSNIKIYGASVIDDVHLLDYEMTSTQIAQLDFYVEPEWDDNTLLLAKFNDNLNGGNITYLPALIDKWIVSRREINESKFTKIDEIDVSNAKEYTDYEVYSNTSFIYNITPVAGDYMGTPLQTEPVPVKLESWFLLSLDASTIYNMCFNFKSTTMNLNESVTQNETFGKYDLLSKGNRSFDSSHIQFIPSQSNNNNEIVQPVSYINDFESFIKNTEIKLLKSPKGEIWKVITYGFNKSLFSDSDYNQTYIVDFDWIEVQDI